MLLPDNRRLDFAFLRAASVLAMAFALSGCFRPLYGSLAAGGDVASELQAIAVDPIPGRIGHYLGNELIFALNGTGAKVPAKYHLTVLVLETVQTPLLDTVTGYPSAATVVLNADYRLLRAGGSEPVATGRVTAIASYDRTSQRFANLRAARDAGIRDAKTLADQIRTRLAAALAGRG
ncbi:MAG: LPS assembly lipoprotein LptE [Beijerinckiaceae bacterium]|nr:LPS assembly lipoprotein LptE [Beijerinckiaceae bacterium]